MGTRIRTVLAVIVAVNTAVATIAPPDFLSGNALMIYRIISWLLSVAALAINTYYNNDYTAEGSIGTYVTRTLKSDPTLSVSIDGEEDDPDELDDDFDGVIKEDEANENGMEQE